LIVSHSNKFIYLKSYKTASTSVEMFFERFCKDSDIVGYRGPNPIPKDQVWYNHMTPSQIKTKLNNNNIWNNYFKFGCVRNPWDRKLSSYFFEKATETFEEYCMNKKFNNLCSFYNLDMDYYIRFEKLHEDLQAVCDLLGLPCDLSQLPHEKKTKHKHYTEYYTDKMRDKIAEDCKADIDFFNYTFGD
tara:strand:- start:46543 stop:47106 length:564 start_codon:yes stop_codon:yes gene_type:complete